MIMPYRPWMLLSRIFTPPVLVVATILLLFFSSRGLLPISEREIGLFVLLSLILIVYLRKSKKACPLCHQLCNSTYNGKCGFYLACDTCGAIRGSGFLGLTPVVDPVLYPKMAPEAEHVAVDIGRLTCDGNPINGPISPDSFWASVLKGDVIVRSPSHAVEIDAVEGRLMGVSIMMENFQGRILVDHEVLPHSSSITLTEIRDLLGPPYWQDEDDDEILLFYEFAQGELQLEFADKQKLSGIILSAHPVMACAEQRKAYNVTAPWPPSNLAEGICRKSA